jgi:hypothetical protein
MDTTWMSLRATKDRPPHMGPGERPSAAAGIPPRGGLRRLRRLEDVVERPVAEREVTRTLTD